MIVRSTWIAIGKMAQHVTRTDTNEEVEIIQKAERDATGDVHQILFSFEAISQTNVRVKRTLIHVRIAPERQLDGNGLSTVLDLVDKYHGIPNDQPRLIIRHKKGTRADHFHVFYPSIEWCSGTSIKSHGNFARDEVISRKAELHLGERVVPGPRMGAVIALLRDEGKDDEVNQLVPFMAADSSSRMGQTAHARAVRTETDVKAIKRTVFDCWSRYGATQAFKDELAVHGMRLAVGDRDKLSKSKVTPRSCRPCVMIVEDQTAWYGSLSRTINEAAKDAGEPARVLARHMLAFKDLPPLAQALNNGIRDALDSAAAGYILEARRLERELSEDGELDASKKLNRKIEQLPRPTFRATLAARRREIRSFHKRRDRVRRARVERAFKFARIWGDPRLKRLAFAAAAVGCVLGGGGVGLALIAGGCAHALLPSFEKARAAMKAAQLERARDSSVRARELIEAYQAVRDEFQNRRLVLSPRQYMTNSDHKAKFTNRTISPMGLDLVRRFGKKRAQLRSNSHSRRAEKSIRHGERQR